MSATILDGAKLAKKIKNNVRLDIEAMGEIPIKPALAVVIVGQDPASKIYVKAKQKDCAECGIVSHEFALDADVGEEKLLNLIQELNNRKDIHGILCQLPLPKVDGTTIYNEQNIIQAINPKKDVDAFHFENVGRIMNGDYNFLPCTPAGVMALLEEYNIDVSGKSALIVNRSNIVGKPQAMLLMHKNATITIAHSKTKNIPELAAQSDILVLGVGRPNFITGEMVKEGAVVVDISINRLESGKLVGDVDFDAACKKAAYITPVPGGIGPMTRAVLMQNTLKAFKDLMQEV